MHHGSNPNSFSYKDDHFVCFSCGESGKVTHLLERLSGALEGDDGGRLGPQATPDRWLSPRGSYDEIRASSRSSLPTRRLEAALEGERLAKLRLADDFHRECYRRLGYLVSPEKLLAVLEDLDRVHAFYRKLRAPTCCSLDGISKLR